MCIKISEKESDKYLSHYDNYQILVDCNKSFRPILPGHNSKYTYVFWYAVWLPNAKTSLTCRSKVILC